MATDRKMEQLVGLTYPRSLQHLQQLIMDAETCSKNYGKKSLFGRDKFEPAFDKFMATIGICVHALVVDGHLENPNDPAAALAELNIAMGLCEAMYSSWPLGFSFWNDWYTQFRAKLERDEGL
jgi:hypothetical protein